MPSARIQPLSSTPVPAELDVVGLLEPVETEQGIIPRGTEGTVVIVFEGRGYGVEFDEPFQEVVNVRSNQVRLLHHV